MVRPSLHKHVRLVGVAPAPYPATVEDVAGRMAESERFVSDFAVACVHMPAARVPSEIDQWMTPLVSHMGVDCAMVAQYLNNNEHERFTATHVAGWPLAVRH
ncbi:MAG TPA: hypothetical protein VIQ28_02075, partial [Burkholderiales bacterium]